MMLSRIVADARVEPIKRWSDAELGSMSIDSRTMRQGGLFVCMPGMTNDSQRFLVDASVKGAMGAIVYDSAGFEQAVSLGLAAIQLPGDKLEFSECIWRICDSFFEHPTRNMKVVGVTGTNGKTTTAWLVREFLGSLGMRPGYLGTLGFQMPGVERELANTTPFAVDVYNLLAEARDAGVDALAMEVSSHALAERRVDGVEFDVAAFTNLTQDHLDYHGSMDEYERAKRRLFFDLPTQSAKPFVAAINVADKAGERLALDVSSSIRYRVGKASQSLPEGVDLIGQASSIEIDRIHLRLESRKGSSELIAGLGGSYNVENLLAASAVLVALGIPIEEIDGSHVRPVPGRFEPVPNDAGIGILVDYAHTPDALEKLLDAVRPLTKGRVITVFGCGGDRDKTKRPKMARAADSRSDITVVTSDNPRTEDPQSILNDVMAGIEPGSQAVAIIDRQEAVAHAIGLANPGDVVVIAGKGHENYQIIGRTKQPMDDRKLAQQGLSERMS